MSPVHVTPEMLTVLSIKARVRDRMDSTYPHPDAGFAYCWYVDYWGKVSIGMAVEVNWRSTAN